MKHYLSQEFPTIVCRFVKSVADCSNVILIYLYDMKSVQNLFLYFFTIVIVKKTGQLNVKNFNYGDFWQKNNF